MSTRWAGRTLVGMAAAMAVACGGSLDSSMLAGQTAQAEPPKAATPESVSPVNTGNKPGDGFLIDLTKGHDEATQYLSDYEMNADWIKVAYRPDNIEFANTGMTLRMQKTGGKLPIAAAEFQRVGFYGYGRYEVVLRASPEYGAVSSFFTFTDSNFGDPHDEIDFEFLGRNPHSVHLNYFHKGESDPQEIPLWFDAAMADHLYAFEWTPNAIRWFVDGRQIREVTSTISGIGIPTTSSKVIANIWAGAGSAQNWTGEPRFRVASATYRCMSHVPMGKTGKQCSDSFKPPPRP